MRVLYITNNFPYPLTSGYLRHYFLVRELARRHEVTLFSLVGPGFREAHAAALRPFTRAVVTFRAPPAPRHAKALRRALAPAWPPPHVRALRAHLEAIAQQELPDVVVSGKAAFPALGPLLRRGVPLVADLCDATSARLRRTARHAPRLHRPWLRLEGALMARTERALMQAADHAIFISCRDREDVLGPAAEEAEKTTIVPNGVDLAYWKRSTRHLGRHTLIFTGAMNYRPNADAALHLIREILPAVEERVPEVRLLIVGKDPPPALQRAGRRHNVTVTGFVEDMRPYLEQATVFAAPLRFGAGMQNKLLEAMAMEVPVVASPLAADGLRTEEGERPPIHVPANTAAFVEALVRALEAHSASRAPDREARRFVQAHFVWEASGEKLDRVLHLVRRRPRRPPAARLAAPHDTSPEV